MQTNMYDWYQIIDTRPDESMLEKRKQAIEEIISYIVDSNEWDPILGCIAVGSGGLEFIDIDKGYLPESINCFKSHLLSFPSNITENGLELRVASGFILEDLLSRNFGDNKKDEEQSEAKIIAPFFLTGIGLKDIPSEKYLGERINHLKNLAEDYLERRAQSIRHRKPINLSVLAKASLPTDQATWEAFMTTLKNTFSELERQTVADREEIEILWWLQNGVSRHINQPFISLSPVSAAIQIGIELAELTTVPPLMNNIGIVQKAVEKNRKANSITPKPLSQLIEQKDFSAWTFLSSNDENAQNVIKEYPPLLPLYWLGTRINESKIINPQVMQEFQRGTGVPLTTTLTPFNMAMQVFRETIAIKNYLQMLKD